MAALRGEGQSEREDKGPGPGQGLRVGGRDLKDMKAQPLPPKLSAQMQQPLC